MNIGEKPVMTIAIVNTGGGMLTGTIESDRPWVVPDMADFNSNNTSVSVSLDSGLFETKDGEFSGNLTIATNGGTIILPVSVTATCVLVKPNPYKPRKGSLTFFGSGIVPGNTTINIYTLSGELVANCQSSIDNGQLSEIAWDGLNAAGVSVTPGIYIYTYASPREKGVGKFTVVR
jgi:hypothetical protein